MEQKKYHLKISVKTKILNFFRQAFKLAILEKTLVRLNTKRAWLVKKIIPPNYLYKKGSHRAISRNGIRYSLDISQVVDHLLYFGFDDNAYASVTTDIKNAAVIFDVGANIGTTTLFFAQKNPRATIYAFEPHPDTFIRLKENIALNDFSNTLLINEGLGEKMEYLNLYEVNSSNPGMNRIKRKDNDHDYPFKTVYINTIDQFVKVNKIEKIDFIKIDVEGFELSVLKGAEETLKASKPIIFLELDDNNLQENGATAKTLIEFLMAVGYQQIYRACSQQPVTANTNFGNCHFDVIAR